MLRFYTITYDLRISYYKKLEHKNVVVEKIVGKEEAFKIVNESVERYNKAFITED